ncbi:hypothetical protein [Photobacterium arenosum]|nr:hypothetical protein [Photobacterium arenosum]
MTKCHRAWTYACQFKKFTGNQLIEGAGLNGTGVRRLLRMLLENQRIEVIEKRNNMLESLYRIIDDTPLPTGKRPKSKRPRVQQRLWNVCRMTRNFSYFELRALAEAGESTTRRFVRCLVRSRIIRQLKSEDGEFFRLNVDLGRLHPIPVKGGMRCQNKEKFYPYQEDK